MSEQPSNPNQESQIKNQKSFDWSEAKQRLANIEKTFETADRLSPEQAREVMDGRARRLAEVAPAAPDTSEAFELLTLALGGERFALETRYVHEVIRHAPDITPVPGAPEFVVGVMNLRGEVVAVTDLRRFFDLGGDPARRQLVVLGESRVELAIAADAVMEVIVLRIDEALEPPGSVAGVGREYLRGVTEDAMLVLDGRVLLEDARLIVDEK